MIKNSKRTFSSERPSQNASFSTTIENSEFFVFSTIGGIGSSRKKKEKKEREMKRASETPIFLNEQPWNKFEPLPSDRTAARHHRRNLCRTIRRHLEIAAALSLISAGSRRSRVPADNFRGRRTCGMCHVLLSHGQPFSILGLQLQGWKEDGRVNVILSVSSSPLSLSFFVDLHRTAAKR